MWTRRTGTNAVFRPDQLPSGRQKGGVDGPPADGPYATAVPRALTGGPADNCRAAAFPFKCPAKVKASTCAKATCLALQAPGVGGGGTVRSQQIAQRCLRVGAVTWGEGVGPVGTFGWVVTKGRFCTGRSQHWTAPNSKLAFRDHYENHPPPGQHPSTGQQQQISAGN